MLIWRLEPVDLSSEHWALSTWKAPVVVRAPDEQKARRTASLAFDIAAEAPRSGQTLLSPWQQVTLVRCIRLHASGFEERGPVEVLDPAEHD
jgi:hypothetical protein